MAETERLLKEAAVYKRMGDYVWALRSFDKAVVLLLLSRDYARAATVKRDIAEIHAKNNHTVPAVEAYLESASYFEKVADKKACMNCLALVAYLCIAFGDYWNALFQFERLIEYYTRRDQFRCSKYAYDACLCLLAHSQVEDLSEIFDNYRSLLISDDEKQNVTSLLDIYRKSKPAQRKDWIERVFTPFT